MNNEVILSVLDEKCAPKLAELEKECFSCPWSEESFKECLSNDRFYFIGAFDGDELIGYGGIMTVFDEGDVVNVAVESNFRCLGIGRKLLDALCIEAKKRGVALLHLEVREGNDAARHLYDSFGFVVDGIRKNYYIKPQENAVLMTKKL